MRRGGIKNSALQQCPHRWRLSSEATSSSERIEKWARKRVREMVWFTWGTPKGSPNQWAMVWDHPGRRCSGKQDRRRAFLRPPASPLRLERCKPSFSLAITLLFRSVSIQGNPPGREKLKRSLVETEKVASKTGPRARKLRLLCLKVLQIVGLPVVRIDHLLRFTVKKWMIRTIHPTTHGRRRLWERKQTRQLPSVKMPVLLVHYLFPTFQRWTSIPGRLTSLVFVIGLDCSSPGPRSSRIFMVCGIEREREYQVR